MFTFNTSVNINLEIFTISEWVYKIAHACLNPPLPAILMAVCQF